MKKMIFITMLSILTMSSCSTYTANGAMTGGMFGAMIGSSIGGISGGWRGSHVGQVVGMASGAAIGAAIGAAEEKKQEERCSNTVWSRHSAELPVSAPTVLMTADLTPPIVVTTV